MSASRNRPKKRRQKGRYLPRNRRLVRAESLEPRIVLDGSGLGVISPDFVPTIPINDDGLVGNIDDITGPQNAGNDRVTFRRDVYGGTSFTLDQLWTDADFDSLGFGAGMEDLQPLSNGTESARIMNSTFLDSGVESRDLEASLADRGAADRIEGPGLISLPDPVPGFLPVESSPAPPNVGSIAKTDPAGSEEASKQHATEDVAATGPSGESSESDRAVALSRDRYFASHQGREPVAWSTQSGASEVRQYVYAEPPYESYAGNQSPRVRAASVSSPSTFGLFASPSTASGASSQSGTTAQLLVSASAASPDAPELQHRAVGMQAPVGPHRERPLSESAAPGAERSVRDLLIAQCQPLSVLVGVSLVSAHLIADSRISRNRVRTLALRRV